MSPYHPNWHTQEKDMKRISVNVPDNMYDTLNDFASQHHLPMSLYTRMLLCQAFKIGPELEEVKKRVDELQAVVNGFAEAILDVEPEDLTEEVVKTDHQSA
jgi:hypothetical protein